MNYQQMTIVGKAYSPKVFTRKDGKEYIGFVVPTNVYRSAFNSGNQDSANTSWVHIVKERPSDYLKNLEKGDKGNTGHPGPQGDNANADDMSDLARALDAAGQPRVSQKD